MRLNSTLLLFLLYTLSLTPLAGQMSMTIADARNANADGELTNLDQEVVLMGKAIGPNFRPSGQTFMLVDVQEGIGITVFSISEDLGYAVTDNDNLRVTGTLAQFNGLAEIIPSKIEVMAAGGNVPAPLVTTTLDEATESYLVTIENVSLADPTQWQGSGSYNLDLSNGLQVRIDGDTDIDGMAAPQGIFNITGVGGQFDNEAPFTEGYQLFPRSIADISPYDTGGGPVVQYANVTMDQIKANDGDGVPMMDDELVEISAIVYGINLRPDGLQFTLINEDNKGVGIFSAAENFGYTVTEGDEVTVQGTLGHFNGFTQVVVDSLWLMSTDNDLVEAREVESLDETTESSLVYFLPNEAVDEAQWLGDGSSFNVDFLSTAGENLTLRVHRETDLSELSYQGATGIRYQGLGGQFDNSTPHEDGYQLIPRSREDVSFYLSTNNLYNGQISIYPNPAVESISVDTDGVVESMSLKDIRGQLIKTAYSQTMDIDLINTGLYLLEVQMEEGVYVEKIMIK